MSAIRCRACGRSYDYEKQGLCPKCGAYNRPPNYFSYLCTVSNKSRKMTTSRINNKVT